ncbi:MAG: 4-hydroxy-tetrahydrodipicolinate reductase [Firmicutes bacterium]|nr:4-hydroxy-tetrahydrodipicolinate reductase [Bacillota bacterium]MBR3707211.1 4-hydroxy-tetrahydrodipicolinate reductase [Bacillota bacterium]
MKLGIVGTGNMGKVLHAQAAADGAFSEIFLIEPADEKPWPSEKLDLIIDFSHPEAITSVYDYCRKQGGGIPVVIGTTGYGPEGWEIIGLLRKICPVDKRTNFSRGVEAMNQLAELGSRMLGEDADIRVYEAHHTKKLDAPSGTARTLCERIGITPEEYEEKVAVHRMGSVPGEHSVFFALEDEVLEIRHTAFSKKIFAIGAIEAGKKLLNI